ncbi:MAG: HD domain-containing protein [Victivallales bacterium]|nr:HD domain-containing protein [Victivallales bacterium]
MQPTPNDIHSAVTRIAELLTARGGHPLLVGGCVRDAILGIESKDFDMEVYGLSIDDIRDALASEFALDFVGMAFGVLKVHHFDIDISLPRVENKTNSGHKGFDVAFVPHLSYADAASRRDFTINAIMRDPLTDEIIDPWHGQDDLHKGILRHVSSHFTEDPLRVLRAMQFAARFNFEVAPETIQLCSTLSQDELPRERLATEWEKLLLKGRTPSTGLRFLRDCNWIRYYPELVPLIGCKQDPIWHPEGDVWEHTLRVLDAAATLRNYDELDNLILMLAALCHDFGKPAVSEVDYRGRIISHGHESAGLAPTQSFMARIWNRLELNAVLPLVDKHMRPIMFVTNNVPDRTYRRLALEVKSLELLADLAEADILGASLPGEERESRLQPITAFRERSRSLNVSSSAPKPIVLGRYLLERGFQPGPKLKPILNQCFDAQLNGEFNDLEGGLKFLDKLLAKKETP